MEGRVAIVAVLTVAVALATVPTGGLAQSDDGAVAPGERFAGVVGVQGTEVRSEVDSRAFRVQFARAGSDDARAAVIAEQTEQARERLRALDGEKERLRAARANGSISEGQYRARMARLVAKADALRAQVNRTADASREVPDAALRERGVDPAELERLRTAAGNLTGPEVAALARNLTGDDRGPPAGAGDAQRGSERGPPSDGGNESAGDAAADDSAADGGERSASGRDGSGENDGTRADPDETDGEGRGDGTATDGGDARSDGTGDSSGDRRGDSSGDGTDSSGGGTEDGSGDGSAGANDRGDGT